MYAFLFLLAIVPLALLQPTANVLHYIYITFPCFSDSCTLLHSYLARTLRLDFLPLSILFSQHGCTMAAALLATLPSPTATATTDLGPTGAPVHSYRHIWPTHSRSPHATSPSTPPLHSIAWHLAPSTHLLTLSQPGFPSSAATSTANNSSDHSDQHVFQAQPITSNTTGTASHRPSIPPPTVQDFWHSTEFHWDSHSVHGRSA